MHSHYLTSMSSCSFSCTSIKKPPYWSPHVSACIFQVSLYTIFRLTILHKVRQCSLLALMAPCSFSINSNCLITVSKPIFIWLCPLLPPLWDQTLAALAVFPLLLIHCGLVYLRALAFSACSPSAVHQPSEWYCIPVICPHYLPHYLPHQWLFPFTYLLLCLWNQHCGQHPANIGQ